MANWSCCKLKKPIEKQHISNPIMVNKIYKKVPKKLNDDPNDDSYVLKLKVIEDKVNIKERINAEAESVGIDHYVNQCLIQGINPYEVKTNVSDSVQDFSNCPEDLAGVLDLAIKSEKAFNKLDPELRGNMSMSEFMADYKGHINRYVAKKKAVEDLKQTAKKEDVVNVKSEEK